MHSRRLFPYCSPQTGFRAAAAVPDIAGSRWCARPLPVLQRKTWLSAAHLRALQMIPWGPPISFASRHPCALNKSTADHICCNPACCIHAISLSGSRLRSSRYFIELCEKNALCASGLMCCAGEPTKIALPTTDRSGTPEPSKAGCPFPVFCSPFCAGGFCGVGPVVLSPPPPPLLPKDGKTSG